MGKQVRLCLSDCAMDLADFIIDLSKEDITALEIFLEAYNRLSNSKVEKSIPFKLELRNKTGQPTHVTTEIPDQDTIGILLHRLRPFILTREPGSFVKVMAIIGRQITQYDVRNLLKNIRMLYDGRIAQSQLRIKSRGTIVNSENTLQKWLNSHEYHGDRAKRKEIDELLGGPFGELTQLLWIWLLSDKLLAIHNVAGLIELVMGFVDEYHFDGMIMSNKVFVASEGLEKPSPRAKGLTKAFITQDPLCEGSRR